MKMYFWLDDLLRKLRVNYEFLPTSLVSSTDVIMSQPYLYLDENKSKMVLTFFSFANPAPKRCLHFYFFQLAFWLISLFLLFQVAVGSIDIYR